ncbi:MAG TPA: hypothetical protein VKO41_07070, partial [Gaiellaceae bacterium]|nr:hypothetical protein [Gaiellaceae bacterium]
MTSGSPGARVEVRGPSRAPLKDVGAGAARWPFGPGTTTPLDPNVVFVADATASWEQHVKTERTEVRDASRAARRAGAALRSLSPARVTKLTGACTSRTLPRSRPEGTATDT